MRFSGLFLPVWIYLGLNGNRFWFLILKRVLWFKTVILSIDAFHAKPSRRFYELRISEKDWQLSSRFSNFSFFWVSGPPRNAAKGVNYSRRFVESPRMIDNLFRSSPRMFFNNINVSLIQLSILLGDSTNLREGLVWNASRIKITA